MSRTIVPICLLSALLICLLLTLACQPVSWHLQEDAELRLSTEAAEVNLVTVVFDGTNCVGVCNASVHASFGAFREGDRIESPSEISVGGESVTGPRIIPADESRPPVELSNDGGASDWSTNLECAGNVCNVIFSVETSPRSDTTDPFESHLFVEAQFSGRDEEPEGASVVIHVE